MAITMSEDTQAQCIASCNSDPRFNEVTSKRQIFAAMAMQGLLANPGAGGYPKADEDQWTAALAVKFADALIAELGGD